MELSCWSVFWTIPIFWAAHRWNGGHGPGVRLVEVSWIRILGLCWTQKWPEVVDIGRSARSPVILVIYAEGNDLCVLKTAELLTVMQADCLVLFCLLSVLSCFLWNALVAAHGAHRIYLEPLCYAGMMKNMATWQHRDLLTRLIVRYTDCTVKVVIVCNSPRREAYNELGAAASLLRTLLHREVLCGFHRRLWGRRRLYTAWAGCWFLP